MHRATIVLLASTLLLNGAPASCLAGIASAHAKIFGPDLGFGSGKATAVTRGRCCIRNQKNLGVRAEDPATACNGTIRVLPPSISSFYVVGLVLVGGHGSGWESVGVKTKDLYATSYVGGGGLECVTIVADPITVQAESVAYSTPIMQTLDTLRIETATLAGGQEHASYHRELSSNLTGSLPLYTLDVKAEGGSTPVADFQISATLTSQGWNEGSLEGSLNLALSAGLGAPGDFMVTHFQLPSITFNVPANTPLVIDTRDSLGVDRPESPSRDGGAHGKIKELGAARPNPAHGPVTIPFYAPGGKRITLTIHDLTGRLVATLADAVFPQGSYDAEWDGRSVEGRPIASGIYIYQLSVHGEEPLTRRLLILH